MFFPFLSIERGSWIPHQQLPYRAATSLCQFAVGTDEPGMWDQSSDQQGQPSYQQHQAQRLRAYEQHFPTPIPPHPWAVLIVDLPKDQQPGLRAEKHPADDEVNQTPH